MKLQKLKEKIIPLAFIITSLSLNFFYLIKGVVVFDIDVARDFLLMDKIIAEKHLTLIGARTAIDGVFHGPFWLYLNLPVFFFGKGNPILLSWFWFLLFLFFLGSIYYIACRFYDKKVGLLSVSLLISQALFFIKSPTNPFASLILFPAFFYLLVEYLKKSHPLQLFILLILGGLLIQSEMVFGLPIAFASCILIVRKIIRVKKTNHLFIFPILLLPLSTFIVFEITHRELQINAFLRFLSKSDASLINLAKISYLLLTTQGCRFFISAPHNLANSITEVLNIVSFMAIIFLWIFLRKQKKENGQTIVKTFLFLYGFFWLSLSLTHNTIYWYYYWAFVGVAAIFLAAVAYKNKLVYLIVIFGISLNFFYSVKYLSEPTTKRSFWKTQEEYTSYVFKNAPQNFGYYTNTLDQISDNIPAYAMIYEQRSYPGKKAIAFRKQKNTYIIVGPLPDGKPFDNSWWVKNRLHLKSNPSQKKQFESGYVVEKYILSESEIKILDEAIFNPIQYR